MLSEIDNEVLGRSATIYYAAHAIAETEPPELYRRMYTEMAKIWLKHGALYQYVVVPAGDPGVVDAWLRLGFAYQQVIATAGLSKIEVPAVPEDLVIRAPEARDAESLREISNLISSYQAGSPCYAASSPERNTRIQNAFGALPEDEESHTLIAERHGRLIGYACAETDLDPDDLLIPENSVEISVCGTAADCRGAGVGRAVFGQICRWTAEQGFENVMLDWRITNLLSSNFWPKRGFTPIAYRMVRRIDEAVYWADGIRGV